MGTLCNLLVTIDIPSHTVLGTKTLLVIAKHHFDRSPDENVNKNYQTISSIPPYLPNPTRKGCNSLAHVIILPPFILQFRHAAK